MYIYIFYDQFMAIESDLGHMVLTESQGKISYDYFKLMNIGVSTEDRYVEKAIDNDLSCKFYLPLRHVS